MLACARLCRCRHLSLPASPWRVSNRASITTSAVRRQTESRRDEDEEEPEPRQTGVDEDGEPTFENWLENDGKQFQHMKPRNWIGGNVPFPLNPSFKPPTPVSDALKSHIYKQFMENPSLNDVRSLATRYGMSIKRVEAILRLKGLEQSWLKCQRRLTDFLDSSSSDLQEGKTLQTGFVAGMESLLGVDQNLRLTVAATLGPDTTASDLQDEAEGNDRLRDRYVRLFWEPVAEVEEPIMPGVLKHAREAGQRWTKAAEDAKSDELILGNHENNPPKTQFLPSGSSPGRPITQFIDVGGKFVDVKEHDKRSKESERRKRVKQKKT